MYILSRSNRIIYIINNEKKVIKKGGQIMSGKL